MNYLFLDIDGVLNTPSTFPLFDPYCVANFNNLLERTNSPKIIISSSWRYLIHNKAMTLTGLEHLFFTHGVKMEANSIVGITEKDEVIKDRSDQIKTFVGLRSLKNWVAIDDFSLALPVSNYQKVLQSTGLTGFDVDSICRKLYFR